MKSILFSCWVKIGPLYKDSSRIRTQASWVKGPLSYHWATEPLIINVSVYSIWTCITTLSTLRSLFFQSKCKYIPKKLHVNKLLNYYKKIIHLLQNLFKLHSTTKYWHWSWCFPKAILIFSCNYGVDKILKFWN